MKLSLPLIFNTTISFFAVLIFFLILLSPLNAVFYLRLIFAILASLCVTAVIYIKLANRYHKISITKRQNAVLNSAVNTLINLDKKAVYRLIAALFEKINIKCERKNGWLYSYDMAIYPICFDKSLTLSQIKLLLSLNPPPKKAVYFFCEDFDHNIRSFSEQNSIYAVKVETLAALLLKNDIIKEDSLIKPKQKTNLFKKLFYRVNGVKFIVYGFTLLLFSFWVFYPIYYAVSGVIFVVFGLIALVFGKIKSQNLSCDKAFEDIFVR